jgi:hypothetical protein
MQRRRNKGKLNLIRDKIITPVGTISIRLSELLGYRIRVSLNHKDLNNFKALSVRSQISDK